MKTKKILGEIITSMGLNTPFTFYLPTKSSKLEHRRIIQGCIPDPEPWAYSLIYRFACYALYSQLESLDDTLKPFIEQEITRGTAEDRSHQLTKWLHTYERAEYFVNLGILDTPREIPHRSTNLYSILRSGQFRAMSQILHYFIDGIQKYAEEIA